MPRKVIFIHRILIEPFVGTYLKMKKKSLINTYYSLDICMAIPVVEFSREGYKIRKVFA